MTRRRLVVVALALLVVVLLVLLLPRGEAPESTLAFRRFLAGMGLEVTEGDVPPAAPNTFVLLEDFRDRAAAEDLLRWVSGGGHLVLANPFSATAAATGIHPQGPAGIVGRRDSSPSCIAPQVRGVGSIVLRSSDWILVSDAPRAIACFPVGGGAYMVTVASGRGRITVLGGTGPLSNELLRSADNAVFARLLVGPGPTVVFGPPLPSGAALPSTDLWSLLPARARGALLLAALAAVAFAAVRGRRLGRPVPEPPVVPIPAGELVGATSSLYRRARARGFAASVLRAGLAARLGRTLGAAGARPEDLAGALARATGLDQGDLREMLGGRDPSTDEELIALAQELESTSRRLEGAGR